ncbi:MAG: prepilin-type N-terminal cleavage/methylation domain-containing protein [Patescibacteria group bacterium]|jgi:prepilin-type N-terminal cleavage/methylation domain-containing protein|nr:prepilin-type N-terminal cleavage/methylation domain-containing protein [Patescibacteria group bacterium]
MKKTNQKGFTLIELLIVIGIIAILAAAVIIAINPGRQFQQARNAARWSHMNSVANAVYSYAIDHGGNFPGCVTTGAADISTCAVDLVDTYMAALPTDPQTAGDNGYMIELKGTTRIKITPDPDAGDDTTGIEVIQ